MTKKIISLILVLPFIVMLCLYTAVSTVSLTMDVPVSRLEIMGQKIVYLNLDEGETYKVDYTVYPTSASNQDVAFSTEKVGSSHLANLEYKDGYIIPKGVGLARVFLTTVDGGFKDALLVQVDSDRLQSITSTLSKEHLKVGEKAKITTTFLPDNAKNQIVSYQSENTSVATVNAKGEVTAVGRGETTITITADADANIFDSVNVYVENEDVLDISKTQDTIIGDSGSLSISMASDTHNKEDIVCKAFDENMTQELTNVLSYTLTETNVLGVYTLQYTFIDETYYGKIALQIEFGTCTKVCVIERLHIDEIQASFDADPVAVSVGGRVRLGDYITITPDDADVSYEVQALNSNVAIETTTKDLRIRGVKLGVTTVVVTVINNLYPDQTIEIEKDVVVKPSALSIEESAETYGIENIWTIAKKNADGRDSAYALHVTHNKDKEPEGERFEENLSFTTNTPKVQVANDGTITMDETFTGLVEITARFAYNDVEVQSAPFMIRVVGDGVNVDNFLDLISVTKAGKPVVLQGDIKEDFGKNKDGTPYYNENNVDKIVSTYDTTFYDNIGEPNPTVKTLVSFREDVYGNGYEINAHNVAYGLDDVGALKTDALFRGPLDFVRVSKGGLVSVKGQDNICFAVYENTTLNNVELRSCDLQADANGQYDLADLNYTGTTVEVLGDNVTIEYSRLGNGRTVLRVFGDIADATKPIHLNVRNSVLTSGRDFIMRVGSNRFVYDVQNASPRLPGDSGEKLPAAEYYGNKTNEQKQDYDDKFINTFIRMKNCAMKDAGIFCVGMDSHFSGGLLAAGSTSVFGDMLEGWHDIAKTSYGVKLTFEGDVRMYDWKDVEKVDSSTLIEMMEITDTRFEGLRFDVKEMIKAIAANPDSDKNLDKIVYNENGKQYVHGGIAFFGGGKNYSVFETENYTFHAMHTYQIDFHDVGRDILKMAAGDQPFYFMLHDSNGSFLPQHQREILASQDAYAFLYQK